MDITLAHLRNHAKRRNTLNYCSVQSEQTALLVVSAPFHYAILRLSRKFRPPHTPCWKRAQLEVQLRASYTLVTPQDSACSKSAWLENRGRAALQQTHACGCVSCVADEAIGSAQVNYEPQKPRFADAVVAVAMVDSFSTQEGNGLGII